MSWVEDANRQVDFLIKQLHLKGTEKILDLACGFGRHSLEFARRGYDVTGIWYVLVSAIPMRMMCPLLHVLPNGLAAEAGNPLLDTGVIVDKAKRENPRGAASRD